MPKIRPSLLALSLLLVLIVITCVSFSLNPIVSNRREYAKILTLVTGQLCWIYASLNILIAARPPLLDRIYPQDYWYRIHRSFGAVTAMLALLHFFASDIAYLFIDLFSIPYDQVSGPSKLQVKNAERKALAAHVGQVVILVLAVALILTFIRRIPYKYWRLTHKAFAVGYLVLLFHLYVLLPSNRTGDLLSIITIIMAVLGGLSALLVCLGLAGAHRRRRVTLAEAVCRDNTSLITLQADETIPGRIGQFFLLRYDRENFHPFSAYALDNDKITFLIKGYGTFTRTIATRLQQARRIVIEGPYGSFDPLDFAEQDKVLYVAQGVGIAPFAGAITQLSSRQSAANLHVELISADGKGDSTIRHLSEALDRLQGLGAEVCYHNGSIDGLYGQDKIDALLEGGFATVYFCGHPRLGRALRRTFLRGGGRRRSFHQEYVSWR